MYYPLAIFNIISKFFLKLLAEMHYGNNKIIIIISEIHNFLVEHFLTITRELP